MFSKRVVRGFVKPSKPADALFERVRGYGPQQHRPRHATINAITRLTPSTAG
jgi:hypothetical protein